MCMCVRVYVCVAALAALDYLLCLDTRQCMHMNVLVHRIF